MALISLAVSDAVSSKYVQTTRPRMWGGYEWEYQYSPNKNSLVKNKEDTYLIVFGPDQEEACKVFEDMATSKFNILYKSPKACNTNYNTGPRNTLFVFELKDETTTT